MRKISQKSLREERIKALRQIGWYRNVTGNFVNPKNNEYITEAQLAEMPEEEFKELKSNR